MLISNCTVPLKKNIRNERSDRIEWNSEQIEPYALNIEKFNNNSQTSSFAKKLGENGANTIDQAIGLLDENILSNQVLIFDSKSRQEATLSNPRVILFNNDASFIATFNGADDGIAGNDLIEIIEFDFNLERFNFVEIKFEQKKKPVLSELNPEKCSSCHTSAYRPIWEGYFSWPGAYGDDTDGVILGSEQHSGLKEFLSQYKGKRRYRHLKKLTERYSLSGKSEPSRSYPGSEITTFNVNPNLAFTILLSNLNMRRIAGILQSQKNYSNNKFLVAAAISNCLIEWNEDGNQLASLPEEMISKHDPRLNLLKDLDKEILEKSMLLAGGAGKLKYVNEKLALGLDINLEEWTLNFLGENFVNLGDSARGYFNDASTDASQGIVAAAFGKDDEDFENLEKDCGYGPNQAKLQTNMVVRGSRLCSPSLAEFQLTEEGDTIPEPKEPKFCKTLIERWKNALIKQ